MSSKPPNLTFKLVLLGDGRVGKTSLVLRYVTNAFSEKQEATIQASYLTKRLVIEGVPITLSIWDTAGQERFHALGPIYYRDADAAILVYDIMDNDTFLRVTKWVKELQLMAPKNMIMAIAANKSDLVRSKKFNIQEAESYASTIGASLFITSAKSGTGIDDIFLDLANRYIKSTVQSAPSHITIASVDGSSYLDAIMCLIRLLQRRKSMVEGLSSTPQKKGIVIIDDEPEKEPPPKCCS